MSPMVERYRELAENPIYPHLGGITLKKLKPVLVGRWHADLLKTGSKVTNPCRPAPSGTRAASCIEPYSAPWSTSSSAETGD